MQHAKPRPRSGRPPNLRSRVYAVVASLVLAATALPMAQAADAPAGDPGLAYMKKHEGTWRGTFSRFDGEGQLLESFPSEISIRLVQDGDAHRFVQTNVYAKPDGTEERIESSGEIREGRAWFSSPRVDGWTMPVAADPTGRMGVLWMASKDGALQMHEVISLSEDGSRRYRVAQYLRDGRLWRRTLIEEALAAPGRAPAEPTAAP